MSIYRDSRTFGALSTADKILTKLKVNGKFYGKIIIPFSKIIGWYGRSLLGRVLNKLFKE
jgi:hypothetical protein